MGEHTGTAKHGTAWMTLYFSLFAAGLSIYTNFISLWLNNIGYSKLMIGALSAASAATAVVLQPVLALAADRGRTKNRVLALLLAGQAVLALLHLPALSWLYTVAVMAAFTSLQGGALALSNAVILDNLVKIDRRERFGRVRIGYSWGFALAAVLAGLCSNRSPALVFPLCAAVNLLALLCGRAVPPVAGYQRRAKKRVGFRALLAYREFWVLSTYSLLIHITYSLSVAFLPLYYKELGAPDVVFGIGVFLMAAAETPFLLFSGAIIKKVGIQRLLLVPGVAYLLRWFLTAWAGGWQLLLATSVLQGLGIIVVYTGMSRYVSDNLPPELSATGQAVINSLVISASRIVGALVGGILCTCVGMRATFFWMGVFSAASTALLLAYLFWRKTRSHQPG